jgi:hydrogenase expression/formation protein HypC
MCLAIPGKIISITNFKTDNVFKEGKVLFGGIVRDVNLSMVPHAVVGDYVLVHVGVAISKIDEEEAQKTFEYLQEMGETRELNT